MQKNLNTSKSRFFRTQAIQLCSIFHIKIKMMIVRLANITGIEIHGEPEGPY